MENSIEYIKNLDLEYLALRIINKLEWESKGAYEAVRKYKNFLILRCMHPDLDIIPTPEIDEVWHAHILHTKNYMHDCMQIFGKYLHHTPSSGEDDEKQELRSKFKKSMRLYENTFLESYAHALNIGMW